MTDNGREIMLNRLPKATIGADLFGYIRDEPVPTRRSRIGNNPFSRNSQSTARGRRVAELLRSYLRKMSDRSCDAVANALRAAELMVDAEDVRARRAAGNASIDEMVKAERLARHAVRELGIDRWQSAKPKKTLTDYAQEKAAGHSKASSA